MGMPRDRKRNEFAPVGAFVNSLPSLKQSGSALLVIGDVPSDVHTYASRRMLGQNSDEDRHQLIVLTDGDYTGASQRLISDQVATDETTSIISHCPPARSAVSPPIPALERIPIRQLSNEDLYGFSTAIHEEIADFESKTDGLEPAELRVCMSSIAPLLAVHDVQSVFRFVHLVTGRVKHSKGIVHAHLPIQRDCYDVKLLEPLFDATIELRLQGSEVQQRWRMTDREGMSRWMVM